ncbi:hypothetical protein [Falsiroseomonas oryzae]|uniref:hypothetical protein n=1 Tax=Falsiroseomonas oryzae TaxID=2766473 RepID=UPI0022EB0DA1|nr:hypothetical protein [Roseomonas sp. MO-31]
MDLEARSRDRMRRRIARRLGQRRDRRARRRELVGHALQPCAVFGSAQRAFVHPHAADVQQHQPAEQQKRDASGQAGRPE